MTKRVPTCPICGSLVEEFASDEGTQSIRSINRDGRPFVWQGRRLDSYIQVLDAVKSIGSRAEAQQFIRAYQLANPQARSNVGWLAGYCTPEEADRIYDWFEVVHPVFGRSHPSAEEAFTAGLALGGAAKEREERQ